MNCAPAASFALDRERAAEAAAKAERERREKQQAEAREKRLMALAQRGEYAWREVEVEIGRSAPSYDKAASLLADLRDLAATQGKSEEFERRPEGVRKKHAQKEKLIERLRSLNAG